MARILIIDDEEMLRDMLREILKHAGYEVDEAPDGKAGIERYSEAPADLIITDIFMPEMDGFETIQKLKKNHPGVKIIALTGYGLHNLPVAYDLGAEKVFEKPITPRELLGAVKDLLAE